jgi:hypothetical protein
MRKKQSFVVKKDQKKKIRSKNKSPEKSGQFFKPKTKEKI